MDCGPDPFLGFPHRRVGQTDKLETGLSAADKYLDVHGLRIGTNENYR